MSTTTYRQTARAPRPPLHPLLLAFPAACLIGCLLTDVAYWQTANVMWADFSAWLVSAGVILAFLAAIIGLIDRLTNRAGRRRGLGWAYVVGQLLILVLATLDMLVHTHDAWTSVVPWGLALSAAVTILLLVTVPVGWSMVYSSAREWPAYD